MMPGPTALQRTPRGPNSTAAMRVSASSAAFDGGYTPVPVGGMCAVMEETLTMLPPSPADSSGSNCCIEQQRRDDVDLEHPLAPRRAGLSRAG